MSQEPSFHVVCVRGDGNSVVICSLSTRKLAEAAVRILGPEVGLLRVEIVEGDEPPVGMHKKQATHAPPHATHHRGIPSHDRITGRNCR